MPAQQVSETGHGSQHSGQQQVVALVRKGQQQRVSCFVNGKTATRNQKEAGS